MPFHLRAIRAALRRLNTYFSRRYETAAARRHPMPLAAPPAELASLAERLRDLDLPDANARAYFDKHLLRLARTVTLIPHSKTSGRILELGCYMHITPFLQELRGYREVRGADHGPLDESKRKTASVRG